MGNAKSAFKTMPKGAEQKIESIQQVHKTAIHGMRLKTFGLAASVIYLSVAIAFLFFIMTVFVWVTPKMAIDDVPFYNPTMAPWRVKRWGGENIMFLLHIPFLLVPGITAMAFLVSPLSGIMFYIHMIPTVLIALVWGIGNLIFNLIRWGRCYDYAVCRSQDPLNVHPKHPNTYWIFLFIFDCAFPFAMVALIWATATIRGIYINMAVAKGLRQL